MVRKLTWLLAITGACLLVLSIPSQAQKEKPVVPTKDEIKLQRMQKLIQAYEFVAVGREKQAPEYLIMGANILRQLSPIKDLQEMPTHEAKVDIGEGKAELNKEVKVESLLEQSDLLYQEASDLGVHLRIDVDKLIKRAKERETIKKTDKEEYGVVGGPKQFSRMIAGNGVPHVIIVVLDAKSPTNWGFQSSVPLQVSVVHDEINNAYFWGTTAAVSKQFMPGGRIDAKYKATITFRIRNVSGKAAKYQMFLQ